MRATAPLNRCQDRAAPTRPTVKASLAGGTYWLVVPVFWASGFAALIYQMVWQRLLTFFSGADLHSVTLIVAAFMAGLGIGSLAGGHLADRLRGRQRFVAFAVAESGIAVFAILSTPLIHDVLFLRLGPLALPPVVVAIILFATLLWPTFLMGVSLPLLSRIVADRLEMSASRIAGLYGWNTLGAAAGSLVTVFVLIRAFGCDGAVQVGAVLNAGCAFAGLIIGFVRPAETDPASREALVAPSTSFAPVTAKPSSMTRWLLFYSVSGFIALSLEMLWFRLLGIVLKSSSFTFGLLLAIYLLGLGAGALLGSPVARRSRRPVAGFCALQGAIGLYAAGSVIGLVTAVAPGGMLESLRSYLSDPEPLDVAAALGATVHGLTRLGHVAPGVMTLAIRFLSLYGLVPLLLFGPATVMMGMSFPFLQKAVQTDLTSLGRRVGWLQAANIAGSTAGVVLTGAGLLHWLGSSWTLRVLVAASGVFLVSLSSLRFPDGRRRTVASAAAVLVVAGAVAATPGPARLWTRLHGSSEEHVVFAEDGTGLSLFADVVDPNTAATSTILRVHGLGQSGLPFEPYHVVLGALPVLVHPNPTRVAVIGLGSGGTVFGIAGRGTTQEVDCIEIVASEYSALRHRAERHDHPAVDRLLRDARVRYAFTDGRTFLMRSGRRYDVIEADALRPTSAYAGNLYSYEYFRLLQSRLAPGGLAVTWCPTRRVRDTFLRVFPHVLQVGPTAIGSDAAIPLDASAVMARMREPFTAAHFAEGQIGIERLIQHELARPTRVFGPAKDRSRFTDINTDLFPRDEYLAGGPLWSR